MSFQYKPDKLIDKDQVKLNFTDISNKNLNINNCKKMKIDFEKTKKEMFSLLIC